MTPNKSILLSGLFLIATTASSVAQYRYQPYPPTPTYAQYPQYQQIPAPAATPPSWSYDPYASGLGPCTQKGPLDLGKCADHIAPTYGQPSYGRPIYPPGSR